MQRRADVQGLQSGATFDMWNDYMNLSRLMERLCHRQEVGRGDPKPTGKVSYMDHFQNASPEKSDLSTSSAGSSSASSLSDSSSGTHLDHCRFCKQNGESARVYRSHTLKAGNGKVICPVLRNYICPICEASGDNAHTRRYCPQEQRREDDARFKSW